MMPDTVHVPDSVQSQILLKLGEMATDIAVIKKTLESMPDHEQRIRDLERAAAQDKGGRDVAARVWATLAAAAAAFAAAGAWLAPYLHK